MNKEEWEKLTYGERAWLLGEIMIYLNDESGYYSGWLYIWPDGENWEQCMDDFGDEESYKELEEAFIPRYSDEEIHEAGLYSRKPIPTAVVDAAHYWDSVLGLEPIELIKQSILTFTSIYGIIQA